MINTTQYPVKQGTSIHPALQFLIFIGVMLGVFIFFNLLGIAFVSLIYGYKTVIAVLGTDIAAPHFLNALLILQTLTMTLPLFGTAVVFAYLIVNNPREYIRPSFSIPWVLFLLILAIMLFSNPIIEVLSNINQKMVLPSYLRWMRTSEDQAQKVTNVLLDMKTGGDLVFNVLFIGLLTAIVEEFLFRGALQTIFIKWTGNIHAAVWITAILFSAFHIEFFGFLPRLLLGVFFGYFVAWSGSIWTGVWAHFINNGTAVLVTYLFQHKSIKISPDDQHIFTPMLYVLSFATVALLMFIYKRVADNKVQASL